MMNPQTLVFLAGLGQLGLAVGSLGIPGVLRWRQDVAQLRPLTRQVFWTYAAYIWGTNLFFGIVSVACSADMVAGGPVNAALAAFIALYWSARIVIQFAYFDRSDVPRGVFFLVAEWLLVGLFAALAIIYGYALWINLGVVR